MQNNNLYTDEETKLFESLEDDIDKCNYKSLNESQLKEKKDFLKEVAINTIQKSKKLKDS